MQNRNLAYFLCAEALINIGFRCATLATSWWALSTDSPSTNLSTIIILSTIVGLVTLPLFSPLGDLFSKKKIMLLAYGTCFFASLGIATLAFFEIFNLWMITFLVCIINACHSVVSPVFTSGLVDVSNDDEVQDSFRLERLFSSVTMMLGPMLSALIITISGVYIALAFDCITLLSAFILILFVRMRQNHHNKNDSTEHKRWAGLIFDGFKVKYTAKIDFYWGMISSWINFSLTPFITFTLPFFITQDMKKGVHYLGLNQSFFYIGMLLGSIWVLKFLNSILSKDKVCILAVFSMGFLMILVSITAISFPEIVPFLMMLIGISIVLHNINGDTYKTLALPAEFRARVSAVNSLMTKLIVPVGTYVAGLAVIHYPTHHYILLSGLAIIAMAPCMLMIPGFKRFLRLPESEVEEVYLQLYPKLKTMMNEK
jgi:MFS family permease